MYINTKEKNEVNRFKDLSEVPAFFAIPSHLRSQALRKWVANYRVELIAHVMGVTLDELKAILLEYNLEFPLMNKRSGSNRIELHGKSHFKGIVDTNFFIDFEEFASYTKISQMKIVSDLLTIDKNIPFAKSIKKRFNVKEIYTYFYSLKTAIINNPPQKNGSLPASTPTTTNELLAEYDKAYDGTKNPNNTLPIHPEETFKSVEPAISSIPEIAPEPPVNDNTTATATIDNNVFANIAGTTIKINGEYSVERLKKKLRFLLDELEDMDNPDGKYSLSLSLVESSSSILKNLFDDPKLLNVSELDLPF